VELDIVPLKNIYRIWFWRYRVLHGTRFC